MSRPALLAALAAMVACNQEYEVLSGPVEVDPADVTECPFTPIGGTRFQRYDCNPVFTGTDEGWAQGVGSVGFHAEEVLGHAFYQMWYATGRADGNGVYGLGYAISADGTTWDPLPANPVWSDPGGGWNKDSMGAVTVVWDDDAEQYVLAYQGVNFTTDANGLGMLTSPDGQNWTEANGGEPFVNLSEPLGGVTYCWPLALTWEAGIGYRGYIGGSTTQGKCEIYGYGGPTVDQIRPDNTRAILTAGQGPHDQEGASSAAVVKLNDTYYMFYTGIRRWEPLPGTNFVYPYNTTVNVATSTDGVNWTKDADNPILAVSVPGADDPYTIGNIAAQVVGPRIHLWIDDYYPDLGQSGVGYFLYEPDVEKHP